MTLWDFVNSEFFSTLTTIIVGSLILSRLSHLWQMRSQRYEIKLKYAQDILATYHDYIRLLRHESLDLNGTDFDSIHSRMLSQVKITSILFNNRQVTELWLSVIHRLANVRQLRMKGNNDLVGAKLDEVYDTAAIATEKMFNELK